jgi:hypothetical protein
MTTKVVTTQPPIIGAINFQMPLACPQREFEADGLKAIAASFIARRT